MQHPTTKEELEVALLKAARAYRDYSIEHGAGWAAIRARKKLLFSVLDPHISKIWIPYSTLFYMNQKDAEASANRRCSSVAKNDTIYAVPLNDSRKTWIFFHLRGASNG